MLNVFLFLVFLVLCQRIFELRISKKNEEKIVKNGGFEYAHGHYFFMKILHAAWLISMVVEVFWLKPKFNWAFALVSLMFFLTGQILRISAIKTLKDRWTTKILIVPNATCVRSGIYRYVRHPNYVGVVLEIFFLPMIHNAIYTAIVFSILNAALLIVRIKNEEFALKQFSKVY